MVGSFYDPELDEGCAFEELISFHGGIGGPQTQPFLLASRSSCRSRTSRSSAPRRCTACSSGWRGRLNGASTTEAADIRPLDAVTP